MENEEFVKVNADNFYDVLPRFIAAVRSSSFLAVDCEFSGLGDISTRRRVFAKDVESRYKAMVEQVNKRALLQVITV
jgi:hypothetical protein